MAVYFIGAREVDLVKIGYAHNPVARFNHLRVSSPVELTLEGAIPGGFRRERELHHRFARLRVRGEWFMLCPDLREMIDASSRPEKFTWASVRLWLKSLQEESEAEEQKHLATLPPAPPRKEMPWERDKRLRDEAMERAMRSGLSQLERLAAVGDIYFPFRQIEEAD